MYAIAIGFVDNKDVADLHNASLDRLDIIAHPGNQHHYRKISGFDDIDFVLTDANRFNDDLFETCGVKYRHGVCRGSCKATQITARSHAANKTTWVRPKCLH